jgi:hypothetical protein
VFVEAIKRDEAPQIVSERRRRRSGARNDKRLIVALFQTPALAARKKAEGVLTGIDKPYAERHAAV